jgi:hypothetical protein
MVASLRTVGSDHRAGQRVQLQHPGLRPQFPAKAHGVLKLEAGLKLGLDIVRPKLRAAGKASVQQIG